MNKDLKVDQQFIYNHYLMLKERVTNNDKETIAWMESLDKPELREICVDSLEAGLMARKKVMTESVFNEEYDRALTLYRTICKENNYEAKL